VSTLSQLQQWQSYLDGSFFGTDDVGLLVHIIDGALAVAPPDGSPAQIAELGSAYMQASSTCNTVNSDLTAVATNKLPAAWRGDVAETASQAVAALANEAFNAQNVLGFAGEALQTWAANLQQAQRQDQDGRDTLHSALSSAPHVSDEFGFPAMLAKARTGIAAMVGAASLAQTEGEQTAALLTALAGEASAERLNASGLDALDAVVLANELNDQSDGGGGILTAAEMTRASQLMSAMSGADLKQFEALLAGAKSPQEAAYLMKALAAGNSPSAVKQFDALIHPFGNDPAWLSKHLAPDLTSATYGGVANESWGKKGEFSIYNQGPIGDCVSASVVVARANLDPVFMLKLTTGDQPGLPGADSPSAFFHRLQGSFISQWQVGQHSEGHPQVYPAFQGGLGQTGGNLLANSNLGTATGTSYQYVPLHGGSENAAILPRIMQAVSSGQPVPMGVTNGSSYHQVVIIGADSVNNDLQIYNPNAGSVSLVPLQQFINNQANGSWNLPTVDNVELPS
jgi:hypothetical protein